MNLKVQLENVSGYGLRRLNQFSGLEVREPLNDSMVAKLTISMHDPAAVEVLPLERMISVVYDEFLVFRGRLTRPVYDFDKGTVEINAHDATFALKHHYHTFGDRPVDYGYPIDGIGLRSLVESATPREPEWDAGVFGPGIMWGVDDTTHQAGKSDPDSVWRRVDRGTNVWESVQNLSQIEDAPDFYFRPVHPDFPGVQGTPQPGFFCEMDTYDYRSVDKRDLVIFEKGMGRKNAENIIWEPDGTSVRNYWVQVYPGGDRNTIDNSRRARIYNGASINKYGMMMGWESSGQRDSYRSLVKKGKAWIKAYAIPPDFFTIVPGTDRENVPQYRRDYNVGDEITARARTGYISKAIEGRIIGATLTQVNAQTQTKVALDCVPNTADNEAFELAEDA